MSCDLMSSARVMFARRGLSGMDLVDIDFPQALGDSLRDRRTGAS